MGAYDDHKDRFQIGYDNESSFFFSDCSEAIDDIDSGTVVD